MLPIRSLLLGAVLVATPAAFAASYLAAQGAPPPRGASNPMGNELVEGLKATKGCLGVETAMTSSRKSVIFAWFEDKAATKRWYESDLHQTLMMGMQEGAASAGGAGSEEAKADRVPMAGVPDGVPVMCIATITPSSKPAIPGFPMPISQVSIEMYTPLPGGLALNGKFAPAALQVKDMVEATMPTAPAGGDAAPKGNGTPAAGGP